MSTFLLSFDANTSITGGTSPTLEVLIGGVVVSSVVMQSGATSYDVLVDYTGSVPSSVTLRFNAGTGSGGDSINITAASVNNTALNVGTDLTATLLAQGATSGVTASAVTYGHTTPTLGATTVTGTTGDDPVITSGNEADTIDALAGNDWVYGRGGDDEINGGTGNDFLFGEDGADTILGGTGNDVLFGNDGDDILYGEANDDFILGGNGNDLINGGTGNDGMTGDDGDDIMFGEAGNDFMSGDAGDDLMFGDDGNDQLIGGAGNDSMAGGIGDDQLIGGDGDDLISGGAGDDEIIAEGDNDTVSGGAGDDDIYGGDGDDTLAGGDDNDNISGGAGADTLFGDDGDDALLGGAGADTLYGGADDDVLHGHSVDADTVSDILFNNPNVVYSEDTGSFYQVITTNADIATAIANAQATTLNGIAGHLANITTQVENLFVDSIIVANSWIGATDETTEGYWQFMAGAEAGVNFYNGATAGTTTASFYDAWATNEPNDYLTGEDYAVIQTNASWNDYGPPYGTQTADYVIEWDTGLMNDDAAADTLDGGAGNDHLYGYGGDDIMDGGDDNDVLLGHSGADTLDGGAGNDILVGGTGADTIDGGDDNDRITIANGDFVTSESITGGNGTDILSFDDAVTVNFSIGTLNTVETMNGSDGSDDVTISATQFVGFTTIDLTNGTDVINVQATGTEDISGSGLPTVSNVETGNLTGSSGSDALTITGAQIDSIISGSGTIAFAGGTDTLNITSTSADLNTLGATDGSITGLENISASTAGAGVTIDMSGQSENLSITGSGSADTLDGGTGDDTIDTGNGGDEAHGNAGSDTITGGTGDDTLYAYDDTVEIATSSGGTVTILDEDFSSNTGVFSYTDGGFGGSDGANVDVTGTRITTDGNNANGALQVYVDGQNNSSFSNGSGSWDASVSHTANLSNVQITFSYRHILDSSNDGGEDSQVWLEFNGTTYDASGSNSFIHEHQGAGGGGPDDDTGWVTVTIDLPDLTASTTYNLSIGILHTGSSRSNEDAEVRIDDITISGDEAGSGVTNTADIGETNIINAGDGADTIYGSAGTDTLNGEVGTDTIYSASANEAWDAAVAQILADNAGVSYSSETNSFYQYVGSTGTWTAANSAANSSSLTGLSGNGHLATITSQTENDFIETLIAGNYAWLAGDDSSVEGEWQWNAGPEAGRAFATSNTLTVDRMFLNWEATQPNEGTGANHLYMYINGEWADRSQSNSTFVDGYVIEWDATSLLSTVDTTTINGGSGADTLYGNDGIDTFMFETASWDATDTIENFRTTERDALDISDLLSGYSYATSDINDFVQLTEASGNTTVSVDADGTGGYTAVAILNGVTGLDLYQMISADNLIV